MVHPSQAPGPSVEKEWQSWEGLLDDDEVNWLFAMKLMKQASNRQEAAWHLPPRPQWSVADNTQTFEHFFAWGSWDLRGQHHDTVPP